MHKRLGQGGQVIMRIGITQGLRKSSGKAKLLQVSWQQDDQTSTAIYQPGTSLQSHAAMVTIPAAPDSGYINIELTTPTRIRNDGTRLGASTIQLSDFIKALHRRYRLLMQQYQLPELIRPNSLPTQLSYEYRTLRWQDWTRYSSRQAQEMTLGGLVGLWQCHSDDIKAWWPFLFAGQWLHVGKNAAFGMGQYQIHHGIKPLYANRTPINNLALQNRETFL